MGNESKPQTKCKPNEHAEKVYMCQIGEVDGPSCQKQLCDNCAAEMKGHKVCSNCKLSVE